MNKTTWIVGIIILIAVLVGVVYLISQHAYAPAPQPATDMSQSSGTGNVTVGATGKSSIVTYSDAGFSPQTVTIAPGTTVTWNNTSTHTLWVKGTEGGDCATPETERALNECASVASHGTYSHTFTTSGTYTYINNDQSSDTGTIIVSEAVPE